MAIRVAVQHLTRYSYDRLVELGPQVVRLRPAAHCKAKVVSYSLRFVPSEHFENWQQDPYGNFLARYVVPKPTREVELNVEIVVDIASVNPFDFFLEPGAEQFPFTYEPLLARARAVPRERAGWTALRALARTPARRRAAPRATHD